MEVFFREADEEALALCTGLPQVQVHLLQDNQLPGVYQARLEELRAKAGGDANLSADERLELKVLERIVSFFPAAMEEEEVLPEEADE